MIETDSYCKKRYYALFINEKIPEIKPRFFLYLHKKKIQGYRQMTAYETEKRLAEIGKFYEANRGFILYNNVDINKCLYCSSDYGIWELKGAHLYSGDYGSNTYSCADNKHGICLGAYRDEERCFKFEKEFYDIKLYNNKLCRDKNTQVYALFINENIPEVKCSDYGIETIDKKGKLICQLKANSV